MRERTPGGWLPEQRLSPAQALDGFTAGAAHAGFDEKLTGRLVVGLQADFVILSADPLAVPAAKLPTLEVVSTWVDGQAVYRGE